MNQLRLMILLFAIAATGAITFSSCNDDDDNEPFTPYLGDWTREAGTDSTVSVQLILSEDMTFAWVPLEPQTGHTASTGSYSVSDNRITFFDDSDCPGEGIYDYSYQDGQLNLQMVSDACTPRISGIEGIWDFKDKNSWIALAGSWLQSTEPPDTTFQYRITFEENGSFMWETITPAKELESFSGKFAATLDNIIFYRDTHCDVEGYYHFNIDELELTIAFVDDGCGDRSAEVSGIWILEESK